MTKLSIRPLEERDLMGVQAVARATWPVTYKDILPLDTINTFLKKAYHPDALRKAWESDCQLEPRGFFVACAGERVIGYTQFVPSATEIELTRIYVLSSYQQRGVGKALVRYGLAQQTKQLPLMVWVEKENEGACRFYETCGFTFVKEIEDRSLGIVTWLSQYQLTSA
ncbi:GNAT family N-acetyltransferase [Mechercharimyces sp. CAU 1602]|uniref:GNAT family N-acetyltransferase n=1 Tax=Mechercharimyces sp. CAU 1602 TaxID=2973933 RepID=UPI002162DA6C|nr:GNAT family N-acetyltransferase [Mechercharimyces sp. CAU 1602]MCS1350103.1 GNAT family N-acetyltransferase [Mechercharimyces sp. CAU 1602]